MNLDDLTPNVPRMIFEKGLVVSCERCKVETERAQRGPAAMSIEIDRVIIDELVDRVSKHTCGR